MSQIRAWRAQPTLDQRAELAGHLAAPGSGSEFFLGGEAHRELGHLPFRVQGGQPGLPGHGGLDYPGIDVR
jgi:hypothetical protein